MDLAKELGVTSKDLVVALEAMGHKSMRATSPLTAPIANELRVKLGRGRELPAEAKPKRAPKPKEVAVSEETADVAALAKKKAEGAKEGVPRRVLRPTAKTSTVELPAEPTVESVKPAATIFRPAPAPPAPQEPIAPATVAPPPPATPPVPPTPAPPAPVLRPTPPAPAPVIPMRPAAAAPAPTVPKRVMPPAPAAPIRAPAAPAPPAAAPRPVMPPPMVRPAAAAAAPAKVEPRPAPAVLAEPESPQEIKRELIKVPESVTVGELAAAMRRKSGEVIKALLELGVMATLNEVLDPTAARLVADKFHFDLEVRSLEGEILEEEEADPSQRRPRPPVVTVMGHVDHGKTSLLDAIRTTKVAEREFGGITQHIGAYQVDTTHGHVTFLDTPGHEAFTAMRARGAQATDIVILVVAADDGVMPQTVEAVNHAKAANVPIIVAVNKIDKPNADPDRVKRELSNLSLVPEEWGGQSIFVHTSAKRGDGIAQLLEMTALQAEVLELRANPSRAARGVIVEGRLDRGRGPVATALVQSGTLRDGDALVVGSHSGRVRAMFNDRGKKVTSAGPSDPVEILGLSGVPQAGDTFLVVADERKARQIATVRTERDRLKGKGGARITLEDLHKQIQAGEVKELRLILKADAQGSVEALTESLERLSTDEVRLKVIHSSVGAVNESDVMLASASNAIVLGFNVKADAKAASQAQAAGVDLRSYNVIYDAINELKAALSGMLAPEIRETLLGRAQVRQLFPITKVGTIFGSSIIEGKIVRGARVRVKRGETVLGEGTVGSLKRFKDDVREVLQGLECGIGVDGVRGIQPGDIIEAFTTEEVARTL
ncbi:MAG TPA: translation initiation factor IF-2 [Methylomirabilota bacterium]|jgi:translation initiation factor IF-2|nr:translation initiation factor IF-2 [Methylomirabilota bacterium]